MGNPDPRVYKTGRALYLDFETTSLDKGSALTKENRLLLACWILHDGTRKYRFGEEYEMDDLLKDISESDFIVGHNLKFELGWLRRCGLDLHDVFCYDTMLAEWVLGGNLYSLQDMSLGTTCARYGLEGKDLVGNMIKQGINPENIPKPWLLDYCFIDVERSKSIMHEQLSALESSNRLHLQYARCLLTPVLADMEFQGLTLIQDRVIEEYEATVKEYTNRLTRLEKLANGINFRSRPQLAELLYDNLGFAEVLGRDKKPERTAKGARKTDNATIARLSAKTKVQKEFLECYKGISKLSAKLSKSLNFFKGVCDYHGGTFYGVLNQGTTATHRLSSSGKPILLPNPSKPDKPKAAQAQLQNLPREFKRLFRAKDKDWLMFEADGSGLEFRTAVALSQDKVGISDINEGTDVHSVTRDVLIAAGKPGMKADKKGRQAAKAVTFSPAFGGMGKDEYEKEYVKFFREKYKDLYAMQSGWTNEVLKNKALVTPYGMRFYWPDVTMSRSGYISNTTNIFNYPIQGFATAEIIPITLVHFWHKIKNLRAKLVLTVHDSLIAEVHPEEVEKLKPIVIDCFTNDVYHTLKNLYKYDFKSIPLGCVIKSGKNWGDDIEEWGDGIEESFSVMPK